jgi:tetratricopeptide (TPR) repeat protein
MFVRKLGRRVLMLHSFRDGRGKVCQRRLGHFCDAAGLERQLAEFPERYPEFAGEVDKLRAQGQALLGDEMAVGQQRRVDRVGKAIRSLLAWLAEEDDPRVVHSLATELGQLQARLQGLGADEFDRPIAQAEEQIVAGDLKGAEESLRGLARATRSALPARRRCFDPGQAHIRPHLQVLDRLGDVLARQARLSESAQVMAERVKCCPTATARLTYGSLLQKLGRHSEAAQQYQCVPDGQGERHYNLASLCWQQGQADEALVHLLRGLLRDPHTMEALARMDQGKSVWRGGQYWESFGDLWSGPARQFALAICRQMLVRRKLDLAQQKGVRVRNLVPARSRVWLLERGLAAADAGPG